MLEGEAQREQPQEPADAAGAGSSTGGPSTPPPTIARAVRKSVTAMGTHVSTVTVQVTRGLVADRIGIAIIFGAAFLSAVVTAWKPWRERFFVEQDPNLSFPLRPSSCPIWLLIILAVITPSVALFMAKRRGVFGQQVHHTAVQFPLFLGIALQWLVVSILKTVCSRLRPNFLALCDYEGYRDALEEPEAMQRYLSSTTAGAIGNVSRCRSSDPEAHLSFPSGHSSFAFAGLGFLAMTCTAAVRSRNVPLLTQVIAGGPPVLLAMWVSCSRIVDYWHRTDDVVTGALLGSLFAWWAFSTRMQPLFAVTTSAEQSFPATSAQSAEPLQSTRPETGIELL